MIRSYSNSYSPLPFFGHIIKLLASLFVSAVGSFQIAKSKYFLKYSLYSQSCFEQRLVFVTEAREVSCYLTESYRNVRPTRYKEKQRKKNTSLLTCIWPPKLILPWETAFKVGQSKTKPTSWQPSSPSQPEGTLCSHVTMTLSCILPESSQN